MNKTEQIELTEDILKNMDYNKNIAITIAESGAMGEADGIILDLETIYY